MNAVSPSALGIGYGIGEPVTWHQRSVVGEDGYGVDTYAWVDTILHGCMAYPRGPGNATSVIEGLAARDEVDTGLTVLVPGYLGITAVDEMTVRGDRWTINGSPKVHRNPFTARTVTQVDLLEVSG
jgi:hypothetical protein